MVKKHGRDLPHEPAIVSLWDQLAHSPHLEELDLSLCICQASEEFEPSGEVWNDESMAACHRALSDPDCPLKWLNLTDWVFGRQ